MKIKKLNNHSKIKISLQQLFYMAYNHQQKCSSTDIIDKYIDNEFFRDMVDDLCNMDIQDFLDGYFKTITKILMSKRSLNQLTKNNEQSIKKLYNCQTINYNNVISYKYFKEISLCTIPLTKLTLLLAELAIYAQTIKKSYYAPLEIFANFDVKSFIMYILTIQISDILDYGTKQETLDYFKNIPEFYRMFGKAKSSMDDYWYWIFIYDVLKNTCKLPLKNMAQLSKMYAWESFKISENKTCIYKDDEIRQKELQQSKISSKEERIAHNAYSKDEILTIYNAKKTYKTVINMYKFTKFISKTVSKKLNYNIAVDELNKIPLDSIVQMFLYGLNQIYQCKHNCLNCEYRKGNKCLYLQENVMFEQLKTFAGNHLTLIYNKIFNKFNSIDDIAEYLINTKKQDFALSIIKEVYPFFADKTNKTITNIFSSNNIINNEQEYFEQYKESYYEKQENQNFDTVIINSLNTIGDSLELYFKNPTEDKKVFIMMNIMQVKMNLNYL